MPYPATEYGYGGDGELNFFAKLKKDAIKAADPYVNYLLYDHLLFVRTGDGWKYDISTLGKYLTKTDDGEANLSCSFVMEDDIEYLDRGFVTHELVIHGTLELVHANSIDIFTGEIDEYGDQWDNRGANFALIDCLHKYISGLLSADQITIVKFSDEYWLDQRELDSSGTKLLVIFLGYDNNKEPILYYLEYFKELGEFDSQLFNDDNPENKDTVLLRKYKKESRWSSMVYVTNGKGGNNIKALDMESSEFCDSAYAEIEKYGVCVKILEKIGVREGSQAKVKITLTSDYHPPTPLPTLTPTPTPTPTHTPTPTPTSTPTPTPCEADIISISSGSSMNIKKKTSDKVTVEVTSANGCAVEGEMVEAIVTSASGQKRITVSPPEGETDENGQVVFTITAQKKLGNAVVSFWAGNLKTSLYVKVSKK